MGYNRYLNADPIGLGGGINLFAYVGEDPVNGIDPNGLYMDKLTFMADFAEGFLSPTSPPPTPGGLAGYYARLKFDDCVDIDKVKDSISEIASKAWEDYYKIENPGWKYDPYSPYYEPPPKREFYWEQGPIKRP